MTECKNCGCDKTEMSELIKRVEDLKELVERTKNQRDEYYDRMRKLEDRVVKYQKVRANLNNLINTELVAFGAYGAWLSTKGHGFVEALQKVKRKLKNWEAEQCL